MSSITGREPPAPLYTDPIHHAPTDPSLVGAPDGEWRMFYTQRRAGDRGPGVQWVHGTDIGVAASEDGGLSWEYRGVLEGIDPHPGRNTLWAPEVLWAEGRFHMFVSYIRGVPDRWEGHARTILHHVSDDLRTWEYLGEIPLSSDRVIDACVYPLPDGGYRMWFKDEAHGSTTWCADSPDLLTWGESSPAVGAPSHEGPNVFALGGWFWMITDEWHGLGVHRSNDLQTWERQGLILDEPGLRPWDASVGHTTRTWSSAPARRVRSWAGSSTSPTAAGRKPPARTRRTHRTPTSRSSTSPTSRLPRCTSATGNSSATATPRSTSTSAARPLPPGPELGQSTLAHASASDGGQPQTAGGTSGHGAAASRAAASPSSRSSRPVRAPSMTPQGRIGPPTSAGA